MSTPAILAKYGLTNPLDSAVAFTREAEKLRAALKMKTIQVGFTGIPLATTTRLAYTVTGYDEENKLLAVTRDDAADALADVARENARRFGLRRKEVPKALQSDEAKAVLAGQSIPMQYATREQKEEIIRLLNHPVITRPEKTSMLLSINRMDEERAIQAIAKLRKAIDDRENGELSAA